MARRKRSRRHKNHNNRNHFSATRPDSSEEFFFELNVPRNATNFISTLENTVICLNQACAETPRSLRFCTNPQQNDSVRIRSHSCIPKLHSPFTLKETYQTATSHLECDTPKSSIKFCSTETEVVQSNVCHEAENSKCEPINVTDFYTTELAASTPRDITDSETQTEFELKKSKRRLLPTYKFRIKNCDVNMRNVYCRQIKAATEIRAFKNCVQVITILQEFHATYTNQIARKFLNLCCWFGAQCKSGISTILNLYRDHRNCNTLLHEIYTLNETIKALVIDNALLRSEFYDVKQELKDINSKIALQVTLQVPPPPPPPPPPPLPPPPSLPLVQKSNTTKTSRKKLHEQNTRPIISLKDILNVKLRKTTTERMTPLKQRSIDPVCTLKQVNLRPTSSKSLTCSSNETPSTGSSLSNSPQSSLTRLLTTGCKVRRVKRLQNAYDSFDFSRSSPRSQRERASIIPIP